MNMNNLMKNFKKEDWLKNADTCAKCKDNYNSALVGARKLFKYKPNEIYEESNFLYVIDVSKAFEIIESNGQEATYIENSGDLQQLVEQNEIFPEHIYHFTVNNPGLVITFKFHHKYDGGEEKVMVLAEGNHRAKLSLENNVDYFFFYFDEFQTEKITIN